MKTDPMLKMSEYIYMCVCMCAYYVLCIVCMQTDERLKYREEHEKETRNGMKEELIDENREKNKIETYAYSEAYTNTRT